MGNDDDSDDWGSKLDGKESVAPGVSKEMLRKALQLNPAMRGKTSTMDVMNQLEKASAERPVAGEQPTARAEHSDLVQGIAAYRQKHLDEKKRLKEERGKIEKEERELGPKSLERVIDLILRLDPNMTAVMTQEMLKMESAFLNEVGFNVKKVIERKLKQGKK